MDPKILTSEKEHNEGEVANKTEGCCYILKNWCGDMFLFQHEILYCL